MTLYYNHSDEEVSDEANTIVCRFHEDFWLQEDGTSPDYFSFYGLSNIILVMSL